VSVVERAIVLENDEGLPVRADVRAPQGEGTFPVVVVLHGFKGFKDWGMFPPTARRLAERGIATVTMNSSRNGVGERLEEFTELSSFARNTPGREVEDVRLVVDAVAEGRVDGALDAARLGLLGHSRGGGVVILAASRDPRVRAVVTWASIASFDRWTDRAKQEWRARGRIDVPNARTGQILWLDREVLEDLEAHADEYSVRAAARRLEAPLLAVHGEQDEAVDPAEATRLHEWAASREKSVLLIPRTGHTFGAAHPWAGPTPAWERAVDASAEWFARFL
jgi:dienelactone hydrolase